MSKPHASARARKRIVTLVVSAMVASVSALTFGPMPQAQAAPPTLSYVGSASTQGARTSHSVRVPASVQPNDTLVIFLTINSVSGTLGAPAGWTLLQSKDGASSRGRAWTKKAVAADANALVAVATSATLKSTMAVAAYRSSAGTSAVTASASTAGTTSTTSHVAPAVAVAQTNSWLVNSWSEKSSTASTWTKPANSTTRTTITGTGGGKVSSLLADSNAAVAVGTAAARTATTSVAGGATQLFSVVVSPGLETTPTNQPPVPSFTTSCTDLTCSFNAGGTTDPENDTLSYAWAFGDGANGTGITASRTYGSAGTRTVTLTVNDGTTSVQTTRTVSPTNGTATATLSHVATASIAGNRTTHSVRIPTTVLAGDRLVLFMTTNSLGGTLGSPAGWTQLQAGNGTATRGRAWTKQATSTDANALVAVTSTTTIKDTMTVSAYRSTGGNPTVTASAQTAGTTTTTNHTSPSVAVAQPGSWLLNSWSEKSSTAQTWTPPAGSTSRGIPAGTGGGKVSSLVADSNGPIATGTAAGRLARTSTAAGGTQLFSVVVSPGTGGTTPPPGPGTTPPPGHTAIVPENARVDLPKISNGEIFDMVVSGNRVFIAGTFTSIQNQRPGNTTSYAQAGLASYSLDTGLVDASFRPNFGDEEVNSVAVTPDGTKLYAVGTFSSVNGVTRRGIARLDMTTGAAVAGFTADASARATEVAASNTTVYVGGRFTSINGTARGSLAALDAATGQVDPAFVNNITQGIGVSGAIGVQRLVLTHDMKKLVVVHTGQRVAGQDRSGVALVDTVTKQLLPWHSHIWAENLEFVGGIQRAYSAAVSPDDSYFVVTSGSGGDRPPINDTAIAFPLTGGNDVQPMWISRLFDSVYSVAISEKAVYLGGHFAWNESPTANDPWPGQADIGYGTGQGLSAYALGEQVVNREHLGALDPVTGKALEWNPGSNSYEGNKAMVVTPRGLFTGGDATTQAGENIGRIAFFDFNSVPAPNGVETAITEPISGRVQNSGDEFEIKGTASAASGVNRVELSIQNRESGQYLQDNLTTWGGSNTVNAPLASPGAATTNWTQAVTIPGNVKLLATARTVATNATADPSPAGKKFETFNLDDAPPTAGFSSPASGPVSTQTFLVTGTTADDKGVVSLTMTVRNENNRYLQDNGTVATAYNSFAIAPDVPGALNTTWQREITVPDEGLWKAQIRANDTGGQSSLDTSDRNWNVSATAQAPVVSITSPSAVTPPTVPQPFTVTPGQPITFTGSATDDQQIRSIDIALLNNSTQEYLTTDGTFRRNNGLNVYRLESGLSQQTFNWSYTTPYNLTPGAYQFAVLATDNDGITTPQTMWAVAGFTAQVPGDAPPKATLTPTGLQPPTTTLDLNLAGSATDDLGVTGVRVALRDSDTARYANEGGGTSATYTTIPAIVNSPGATSTTWTLPITLPTQGDWNVTAVAFDAAGQYDFASTGATARYLAYPGDTPPTFNLGLLAPTDGTAFSDGRIFVSGRAEDNQAMAKVEVAIVNAANQYMTSSGSFTASPTWVTAFLTSPGTPGSNFSYTSPIIPAGNYTVRVRGTDQHDLVTTEPVPSRSVTVTQPPNNKPVAVQLDPVCTLNVCQFDARTSTDENAPTLAYTWAYGVSTPGGVNAGSATGPNPKKTFTAPGSYTVTLTAKDQWGLVSDPVTKTVTITEPPANAAPNPVINPPSCAGLTCNFSAVGTVDPNTGDSIAYAWNFGDPVSGINNTGTGSARSHVFTAAGEYTVTLTATDGWGKSNTVTRVITLP